MMMKKILIMLAILNSTFIFGQNKFATLEAKHNFRPVLVFGSAPGMEKLVWPKYIDGKQGLDEYIKENIGYPEQAREEKIEGIVVLSYSINTEGKVVDIAVSSESDDHKVLQDELIRVLKTTGPWIPGTKGDMYTKMKLSLSYAFKLK